LRIGIGARRRPDFLLGHCREAFPVGLVFKRPGRAVRQNLDDCPVTGARVTIAAGFNPPALRGRGA
jgi:hypothetical protein